jgi:hypothetical protein
LTTPQRCEAIDPIGRVRHGVSNDGEGIIWITNGIKMIPTSVNSVEGSEPDGTGKPCHKGRYWERVGRCCEGLQGIKMILR